MTHSIAAFLKLLQIGGDRTYMIYHDQSSRVQETTAFMGALNCSAARYMDKATMKGTTR